MNAILSQKQWIKFFIILPIIYLELVTPVFAESSEKILILYKSRDPDHQGLINIYSEQLQQAGYSFESKDVEKLLKEKPDMSSYHGIMTIFQTSQMVGGDIYPEWLVQQMEEGRRILILGSYGAYQGLIENPDGTFTEWNESTQTINTFFYPFGLQFYFAFTGDNQKLALLSADKKYAQYQAPLKQDQLNYYQFFKSINPNNKVFFEVERTDMFDSRSAFNTITPFGGMVLEGYSFYWDPKKKKTIFRVDFPRFMKEVFQGKSPKVKKFEYKTHEELVKENPLPERKPPITITEQPIKKTEIPRQAVLLYKKSEAPSLDKSLLFNRVAVILEYLGLVPTYRIVEDGLPTDSEMESIHSIVTWHTSPYMENAKEYGTWMLKQINKGKKVVILDQYGATFDEETRQKVGNQQQVFKALGIEYVDRPEKRVELVPKVRIADPSMLEYEYDFAISKLSYEDTYRSINPENKVFFSFSDKDYGDVDFGVITANGGISMEKISFYFPKNDKRHIALVHKAITGKIAPEIAEQPTIGAWNINPYLFFFQALGLEEMPVPDVTTLNGSRIFYAHIDGDALGSVSLIDKAHFAGTFIYEEILKKYADIPTSVSVITKNVERLGNAYFHPGITLSRKIFQLDNVDVATHTATHPFDWVGGDPFVVNPDSYPYEIDYKDHNLLEEIWGSKLFADKYLAPPEKKTNILFWSGATNPDERALEIVWRSGMLNLNGGDPRYDESHPLLANLAPYALNYLPYRQYLTSAQNDYYYTLFLTGDWGGQKELIQHFEKTNHPHRIYPMNLYYHFYSGIKLESIDALKVVYDYIRTQDSANIFATQYAEIAEDYYHTHIGRKNNGYWIENNGFLRTLRIEGHQYVDMQRSEGILGFYHTDNNQTYIHLDGSKRRTLYLSNEKPVLPYIIQASQFIDEFSNSKSQASFIYRGFGKTLIKVGGLTADKSYKLTLSSAEKTVLETNVTSNSQGILTFRTQLKAPQTTYSVTLVKKGGSDEI